MAAYGVGQRPYFGNQVIRLISTSVFIFISLPLPLYSWRFSLYRHTHWYSYKLDVQASTGMLVYRLMSV
jgi:hypothetical protein